MLRKADDMDRDEAERYLRALPGDAPGLRASYKRVPLLRGPGQTTRAWYQRPMAIPYVHAITVDCTDPETMAAFWSARRGVEISGRWKQFIGLKAPQPGRLVVGRSAGVPDGLPHSVTGMRLSG